MSLNFEEKEMNYDLLYEYLNEKITEDRLILEVKKGILDLDDYYRQKRRLAEMEYQLLLIRK